MFYETMHAVSNNFIDPSNRNSGMGNRVPELSNNFPVLCIKIVSEGELSSGATINELLYWKP